MNVQFSRAARVELDAILAWLAERSPAAAEQLGEKIERLTQNLELFPHIGHSKYRAGVRVIPISGFPYVVVYRVLAAEVEILSVRHTSRRPPRASEWH